MLTGEIVMKLIVQTPLVTEKNTALAESGVYVFQVALDSTKAEIKTESNLLGEKILQKKINDANEYFKKSNKNQFEEFRKQRKILSKGFVQKENCSGKRQKQ